MIKKYKKDIVIILVLLIMAVISIVFINICFDKGNTVVVIVDDKELYTYDLNEEQTINLPTGNTLVIEDGYAYISHSDCPDKICIKQGKIQNVGETIICLPHKLVVKIQVDSH